MAESMKYKNIERTADRQLLYDSLSVDTLNEIDAILGAYFEGRIDFQEPRFENGEPDFCGDYELIIIDKDYKELGNELLVMKWIEDRENTGYLIECMEGDTQK